MNNISCPLLPGIYFFNFLSYQLSSSTTTLTGGS